MIFSFNCNSQEDNTIQQDRQPYAAGRFYSDNPQELSANLEILFNKAVKRKHDHVLAIISPHAGYVFSGEVAASAYNQINPDKEYENIFIIASSHVKYFDGASVYHKGDYITPLGTVKVNRELAQKLVEENEIFTFDGEAHLSEHSLEVQLPFLQYILKKEFTIVPIVIGSQTPADCETLARALKPYFNENNLFVISSDFSHYPDYDNAMKADLATANAILLNSPEELIKTLRKNDSKHYPNLVTSMCGWTSGLTLLNMTKDNPNIELFPVKYMKSGDVAYGDKNRVVGYYAIGVALKQNKATSESFTLSEKDKKQLLEIARSTVDTYIRTGKKADLHPTHYSEALKTPCGAFVTLHKDKKLRGCIGRFEVHEPLYEIVQQMAIAASTQDSRFRPVTRDELDEIELEVSVLTPLKKIESIEEIELGKHGIYIKKGFSNGTFLPQVATETGWSLEEFLGHCARDKARIGWDGWKNADIFTYEAIVFSE